MYSDNSDTPIWATNTGGRGNGNVFLTVQNDGNVVLYSGEPLWATATNK
jgi:D-mannose binding lectin.